MVSPRSIGAMCYSLSNPAKPGAYAVLAAICIHFLLKRRSNTRAHRIILAYTILMLVVTTIYYVSACVWAEVEFVESTANIELYDLRTDSRLSVLKNTAYVINIYLADSLLVSCLILWCLFAN